MEIGARYENPTMIELHNRRRITSRIGSAISQSPLLQRLEAQLRSEALVRTRMICSLCRCALAHCCAAILTLNNAGATCRSGTISYHKPRARTKISTTTSLSRPFRITVAKGTAWLVIPQGNLEPKSCICDNFTSDNVHRTRTRTGMQAALPLPRHPAVRIDKIATCARAS